MQVPALVAKNAARSLVIAKRESPHIFFGLGIVGTVVSTVLACKATLKLEEVVDGTKMDLDKVKALRVSGELSTEREYNEALGRVYAKSMQRLVKLYGPSVVLGAVSIGSLTGAHVQMSRRNAAVTAAFAAISKSFDQYRAEVAAEIGEDRERELHAGITTEKVKGEDGKTKLAKVADPSQTHLYRRFFDDSNINWQKDSESNRTFLTVQQTYLNHRLHAYGHVFLNEVYDALGLERSKAGAMVGWVIDGPNSDNFIDFGLFEVDNIRAINNMERTFLLDFNVDGPIVDLI